MNDGGGGGHGAVVTGTEDRGEGGSVSTYVNAPYSWPASLQVHGHKLIADPLNGKGILGEWVKCNPLYPKYGVNLPHVISRVKLRVFT